MNYFVIRVQSKDKKWNYLDVDHHSGGYPWWRNSENIVGEKFYELEKVNKRIINIIQSFTSGGGYYFKKEFLVKTLEYVEVGLINTTNVGRDFDIEKMKHNIMINNIQNKLS